MVQRPVMENWQLIKKESDPHVLTWNQRQRSRFQCAECAATGIKRGQERETCADHTSSQKLEMSLGDTILYFPPTEWALPRGQWAAHRGASDAVKTDLV